VLLLVMLEGLSYRDVADIQGVPIGNRNVPACAGRALT